MAASPTRPEPRHAKPSPVVASKGPKPHATLEKWIWILIYAGLFMLILGIVFGRTDGALGWSMAVPGVLIALVGVALIYVRSRYKDSP